jgi:endoglucanase
MNRMYDPDINTGAYGDGNVSDEFTWAAAELFITTGREEYFGAADLFPDERMPIPTWNQVRLLAYYSLIRHRDKLPAFASRTVEEAVGRLVRLADELIGDIGSQPYHTVMGKTRRDFMWGSNSQAANQAVALVNAYMATGRNEYLDGALHNLDYITGRNATGYSFVTGYGYRTPLYIHHRPSDADILREPVPGLLAGGPNPGQQDRCNYPSDIPNESYVDDWCSYASNEIAINWNAPLVYLSGALEALQFKAGYSK